MTLSCNLLHFGIHIGVILFTYLYRFENAEKVVLYKKVTMFTSPGWNKIGNTLLWIDFRERKWAAERDCNCPEQCNYRQPDYCIFGYWFFFAVMFFWILYRALYTVLHQEKILVCDWESRDSDDTLRYDTRHALYLLRCTLIREYISFYLSTISATLHYILLRAITCIYYSIQAGIL